MVDIRAFLYVNNIPQKDIAEYLGVSKGYISQVISGKKELSESNLSKLVNNPYGWDVAMLTSDQPKNPVEEQPEEKSIIDRLFAILAEEQKSNKILLEILKEKDEKIEALQQELRYHREHKGETAHTAESSFSADAV